MRVSPAFNRAGYDKDEAFFRAERIADEIMGNLDYYQERFGTTDPFELACRVAEYTIKPEKSDCA